jgi:hypothetical protein
MTERKCACCGQALPESVDVPALKGKSRKIFEFVRKAGKAGILSDRLVDLVYQDDPNGGPLSAVASVHVLICRVNRVYLKPAGYVIKGEHTGGCAFGRYRLVRLEAAA